MLAKRRLTMLSGVLLLGVAVSCLLAGEPPTRDSLMKQFQAGNYKDAYEGLRKVALDPKCDPAKVSSDLTTSIQCLHNLGRVEEIDEFREAVIAVHKNNWRLLETAAQ